MMSVPFFDFKAHYSPIQKDIDQAIRDVFSGGRFIGGQEVQKFERSFAALTGSQNCIGVGNGTDALFITIKALGIGPGDEVITPAWSWISTSETITLAGAQPVMAEAEELYYTISPVTISSHISPKTRAVIVVHLYGQPADMEPIMEICKQKNIFLIEDCSQSHLASYKHRMTGTWGTAGVFSFYPTKNLGAFGDAGAIITDDDELATKARRFANHGGLMKDEHLMEGMNSRLDALQSAILNAKIKHLDDWTEKRIKNAAFYNEGLKNIKGLLLPKVRLQARHSYHLYVVRTRRRDDLKKYLHGAGIEALVHYPKALPFLEAYQHLRFTSVDFPIAYRFQEEVLSLPVHPELTREQIEYVCNKVREFFALGNDEN